IAFVKAPPELAARHVPDENAGARRKSQFQSPAPGHEGATVAAEEQALRVASAGRELVDLFSGRPVPHANEAVVLRLRAQDRRLHGSAGEKFLVVRKRKSRKWVVGSFDSPQFLISPGRPPPNLPPTRPCQDLPTIQISNRSDG